MPTRREAMTVTVALGAAPLLGAGTARAGALRKIPQRASRRVIVDNDFAGDPDGLVALAHQLLTPKARTVLITTTALDPKFPVGKDAGRTAKAGGAIAQELIRRLAPGTMPPVVAGSDAPPGDDEARSAAARAIVAEAMRDDPLPLVFTCGGPLTNLAAALRLEPRIADRLSVIWIGGGGYPTGGWEYNLAADPAAARQVIEHSTVKLWQVPQPAYRQMQMSIAEMTLRLPSLSPFGAWLYDRFTTPPAFVDVAGSWPLGDSPTVLLSSISDESSRHSDIPARRIDADLGYGAAIAGRTIRVFETLDARLTFDDFFALLALHTADARR